MFYVYQYILANAMYSLKAYKAERQGEREEMQDAALLLDDCTKDFSLCNCGQKMYVIQLYVLWFFLVLFFGYDFSYLNSQMFQLHCPTCDMVNFVSNLLNYGNVFSLLTTLDFDL